MTTIEKALEAMPKEPGHYVIFMGRNVTPITRTIKVGPRGPTPGRLLRGAKFHARNEGRDLDEYPGLYEEGYRKAEVIEWTSKGIKRPGIKFDIKEVE